MKTVRKTKIYYFYIIIMAVTIFAASLLGFVFIPTSSSEVYYASTVTEDLTSSLYDPTFNSSSSTSYPITPSTDNYTTSTSNDKHVTSGIINLTDSSYVTTYPKNQNTNNGDDSENYVLMISSGVEDINGTVKYSTVKYGYITTEGQIELDADSNYILSVDVLTLDVDGSGGIGALYLYDADNDDEIIASITNIDTVTNRNDNVADKDRTSWTTYYFLISTNDITTYNLKLGLFLNGKGTVLFDNISLVKCSDNYLESFENNLDEKRYAKVEKVDNILTTYSIENKNLTFKINGSYTTFKEYSENDGTVSMAQYLVAEDSYLSLTLSNDIVLEKNRVYKITAYIKATTADSVTLNLIQTDLDDDDEGNDLSIDISAIEDDNTTTNGYVAYSFYIVSAAREDLTYQLVLTVGSEDDETTGSAELYISRINIGLCNYENYSSPTDDNYATLNYAETVSDLPSVYLTNGDFDLIEIEDYTNPYPATPSSWTLNDESDGDGTLYYGVINNSQGDELEAYGIPSNILAYIPETPTSTNSNTNMLMLYTNLQKELSYTSSSITLTASTYYVFSADVLACIGGTTKISLITYVNDEEVELVSKTITISNSSTFSTYNLYLYTGYQSIDVYFKISVTASSSYALAFMDEVKYETTTESVYNSKSDGKADLSFAIDENNFETGSITGDIGTAVVNIVNLAKLNVPSLSTTSKNVLYVQAEDYVYYTTQSKNGFTLTSGSYYKISVSVYTQNVLWQDEDGTITEDDVGVSINLSSYDGFTEITSSNGWTTYTFYVNPSDDVTTYITITIGSEDIPVSGEFYIANITYEEIEETEFEAAPTNSSTTLILLSSTTTDDDEDEEDEDEDDDTSSFSLDWETFSYLLSSIIMALAIIVAIIGVVAKKFKFKKPAKKSKNTYDREKTVSKQVSSREASMLREQKVSDLNKELNKLLEERSKYEEEYKRNLNTLRELKIKRGTKNEINEINKELNKNKKHAAAIGVNINKLESEIEYTKSNMYLAALTRKLEREQMKNAERVVEPTPTKEDKTTEQTTTTSKKTTKSTSNKKQSSAKTSNKTNEQNKSSNKTKSQSKTSKSKKSSDTGTEEK